MDLSPPAAPFHADVADAPPGTVARFIAAADGTRLRLVTGPHGPRGTALLLVGRGEYAEKYGRVMATLLALGWGTVTVDWRGQGLSARLAAHPSLGHVARFADYAQDLAAVVAAREWAEAPEPRVLLAHSMGGCIGLRALLDGLPVAGAVFSGPMWGLGFGATVGAVARGLALGFTAVGLGLRRAPGSGARPYVVEHPFAGNVLTSDPATYAWLQRQLTTHPDLGLGGASYGWLTAALAEMANLARAPAPDLPQLALLGMQETVISRPAIEARMARTPRATLLRLPGARHEIWMERPEIQAPAWTAIARFLADLRAERGTRLRSDPDDART